MPIIVQKFGGTSVANAERIHAAAQRAIRAKLAGNQVVLVVSAMGHATDELIELARRVSRKPSRREMDMLLATGEQVSIALMAMAIHDAGHDAVSLTGAQAGLQTDSQHSGARIRNVDTTRIRKLLDGGHVVIVAGFQGVDPDFNITTLGRGGSDTTAVALAAALGADACEIFTDVDGIFTTDPRKVPDARRLSHISYDEMLEMASLGAGVMHGRSIELGKKYGVVIHVRSSFNEKTGTLIMAATRGMEDMAVSGATLKPDITRITLVGLPNEPGVMAGIFNEVARRGVFVDDIIQGGTGTHAPRSSGATPPAEPARSSRVTLSFTVNDADPAEAQEIAAHFARQYGVQSYDVDADLARVSVVGVGMRSHRGVAATLFSALAEASINIENITTSEIVISVLVRAADAQRALQVAHAAFGLSEGHSTGAAAPHSTAGR